MKKLNNKGFAITGILYTLLVIFLLVLIFSLNGLRSSKKILENSIKILEETYEGKKLEQEEINIINNQLKNLKIEETTTNPPSEEENNCESTCYKYKIPYTGKYVFELLVTESKTSDSGEVNSEEVNKKYKCSSYLKKGTKIAFKKNNSNDNGDNLEEPYESGNSNLENVTFVPDLCNKYSVSFSEEVNKLELEEVYKFE